MKREEFAILLREELKKTKKELNREQIEKFYKYMQLLIEWNEKINLTSIVEPKEIIIKHFLDSLTISKHINKKSTVIDIGTGAGFPGIPIKIEQEDIKMTLLDSLNKRIKFLEEVIKDLSIKDIQAIHGRAEDFGQNANFREEYDVCVSRAVAQMNVLIEYMLPFVKLNGICICMKGPEVENELKNAEHAIKELGGKIEKVEKLSLSGNENQRSIIIIKKIQKTPKKYPRKPGCSRKAPL